MYYQILQTNLEQSSMRTNISSVVPRPVIIARYNKTEIRVMKIVMC